ncbi:Oidioi.mRNA.OKI2018_I69.XSR.g13826.t1.cds [Oikopleura dioica]|uniref:Oidioi.mRNA.OKI2018_I69.XSR.g13826.t1.cds n=1 Tax=Oikopleura dioica TaxID=34765 RepID=A0ABN7SGL1_OIKDI|nr:Oidioi.mRNA.OKI2018_I69.XSR.g13826.t1.cds [Oikopleura dioica]
MASAIQKDVTSSTHYQSNYQTNCVSNKIFYEEPKPALTTTASESSQQTCYRKLSEAVAESGKRALELGAKKRVYFTPEQRNELENVYKDQQYPSRDDKARLAKCLNIAENKIQVWFQNRRARDRRPRGNRRKRLGHHGMPFPPFSLGHPSPFNSGFFPSSSDGHAPQMYPPQNFNWPKINFSSHYTNIFPQSWSAPSFEIPQQLNSFDRTDLMRLKQSEVASSLQWSKSSSVDSDVSITPHTQHVSEIPNDTDADFTDNT